MSMRRCAGLLLTLSVLSVLACRVPEPPLAPQSNAATFYDPRTADAITARFPEMKPAFARYRTALAEPVCVVAWEPEYSVWQVFFATNRRPQSDSAGRAAFGRAWGRELHVGTVCVSLPGRERGTPAEPRRPPARLAWLPDRAVPAANRQHEQVSVEPPEPHNLRQFLDEIRDCVEGSPEQDLLLFVHGFNVDFHASVARAAQIALDLPFNGAVLAYSWPSQGGIGNYRADEQIVAESFEPFVQFLEAVDRAVPARSRIHILVHSMGNRLVLAALSRLPSRFRSPPRFANVILAAPDVGVADFQHLAPAAVAVAERATLYVCDSDTALVASKSIHGQQRIGDAVPPVVVPGVETIDASAIETSFMGHSYYGSNRSALSDLFALLKEHRPAAERPWLKAETDDRGRWWSFASRPTEVRWTWYFEELQQARSGRWDARAVR